MDRDLRELEKRWLVSRSEAAAAAYLRLAERLGASTPPEILLTTSRWRRLSQVGEWWSLRSRKRTPILPAAFENASWTQWSQLSAYFGFEGLRLIVPKPSRYEGVEFLRLVKDARWGSAEWGLIPSEGEADPFVFMGARSPAYSATLLPVQSRLSEFLTAILADALFSDENNDRLRAQWLAAVAVTEDRDGDRLRTEFEKTRANELPELRVPTGVVARFGTAMGSIARLDQQGPGALLAVIAGDSDGLTPWTKALPRGWKWVQLQERLQDGTWRKRRTPKG